MSLEAIKFKNGKLEILDQLKLPFITEYIPIETIQDGWIAINEMKVRFLLIFKFILSTLE
jgi:methylthioribose-1-phosphate isomerase